MNLLGNNRLSDILFLMYKLIICITAERLKTLYSSGLLQPPHCTCQSTRVLEMLPLPWRQTSPWLRLSEKTFTLAPSTGVMYTVREPADNKPSHCNMFWVCCLFLTASGCLTRIHSSQMIPEVDTLGFSCSLANRRAENWCFTRGKDVSSCPRHHVETWGQTRFCI